MGRKVARADALIAKIAARQHGAISVGQLYRLGIGERGVRNRVDTGRLHRVHRGTYAVGHPALSPGGRCMAAVLAVGGGPAESSDVVLDFWGAAVSHRSAAVLWQLLPRAEGPIDVVVRGDAGRARRAGIRIHRSLTLELGQVSLCDGIPVTTPARTVADLRLAGGQWRKGGVAPRELRRAVRQANVLGLPLDEESRRDRTRSDLERDFLRICRRHRLPSPEVNVRIGPYLVDFLWRERRLVVETDGYLYHRGRAAFQDDRDRDLELRLLGYDVVHVSERQIDDEPARLAGTLAATIWDGPGT